ncbi:hypothetical protein ACFQX6_28190 [Streptosporangium lutulentum]
MRVRPQAGQDQLGGQPGALLQNASASGEPSAVPYGAGSAGSAVREK